MWKGLRLVPHSHTPSRRRQRLMKRHLKRNERFSESCHTHTSTQQKKGVFVG